MSAHPKKPDSILFRSVKFFVRLLIRYGVFIFLIYLNWKVLVEHWLAIAGWIYLLVALVRFFYSLLLQKLISMPYATRFRALIPIATMNSITQPRLTRYRQFIGAQLSELASAIVWPSAIIGTFLYAMYQYPPRNAPGGELTRVPYLRLKPSDLIIAYSAFFFFCTSLMVIKFLNLPINIQYIILLTFIFHVFIKLLGYCVTPEALTERLRGSERNPYVQFLFIAISIYGMLIISLTGFMFGLPNITFATIMLTSRQMIDISLSKLLDIHNTALQFSEYLIIISNLLLSLAGLTSVLSWNKFKRTNNDYHALAAMLYFAGRYDDALAWLKKVSPLEGATHRLLAYTYLGLNQIDKAEDSIYRYFVSQNQDFNELKIRQSLINNVGFNTLPEKIKRRVLKRYLEARPNESELLITFMWALFWGRNENTGYEKAALKLVSLLTTTGKDKEYPLVFSMLLRRSGNIDRAQSIISNLSKSDNPRDEILRLFTIILNDIFDPVNKNHDKNILDDWMDKYCDEVIRLVSVVSNSPNNAEKEIIYSHMMIIDILLNMGMKHDRFAELLLVKKKLVQDAKYDEFVDAFLRHFRQNLPIMKAFGQSKYI